MIHMQPNSDNAVLGKIKYLVGYEDLLSRVSDVPALQPFDEKVLTYLNSVSKLIMKDSRYGSITKKDSKARYVHHRTPLCRWEIRL